jgi:hypothetical protein
MKCHGEVNYPVGFFRFCQNSIMLVVVHVRLFLIGFIVPALAAVIPYSAARPSWADLEVRLPSSVAAAGQAVYDSTVQADVLKGKTVLFRDRNGWCPYAERVWLALEMKKADYVTCLVDDDLKATTPGEKGSLPQVQWADGTMDDGSAIIAILERIEEEYPHPPHLFPDVSVTVAVVRDSLERFDSIMPRFTLPSSLT